MKTTAFRLTALLLGFIMTLTIAMPVSASDPAVPDVDTPYIYSIDESTIQLGWYQSASIEGVRIYRRNPAGADTATVVWTATAGADGRGIWTDTGLAAGEIYEYCIQTYSGADSGRLFTWLKAVPLGNPDVTGISEPVLNAAGERQVTVSWRAVAEADGYEFWLGMEEGPFDVITYTAGTEAAYTLPEGFLTCNFMARAYVEYRGVKYMGPWGDSMSLYAPAESAYVPRARATGGIPLRQ